MSIGVAAWGEATYAGAETMTTPKDLIEALEQLATTDPGMIAASPGGLFKDRAKSKAARPYTVAKIRHGGPEFVSSGSIYFDDRLEIKVVADTAEQAAAASRALNDEKTGILRNRPFYFDSGSTLPLFEQDRGSGEEADRGAGGGQLHFVRVEYKARTARS